MKCKLCQEWYRKYPETKVDELGHVSHHIGAICWSFPIGCYWDGEHEWGCETVGLIRDLVYEGQKLRRGIHYEYCDDQKYATINIHDVETENGFIGYCLFLTWYKQRGHTDQILILDDTGCRKPTEEELLAIHKHYTRKTNQ